MAQFGNGGANVNAAQYQDMLDRLTAVENNKESKLTFGVPMTRIGNNVTADTSGLATQADRVLLQTEIDAIANSKAIIGTSYGNATIALSGTLYLGLLNGLTNAAESGFETIIPRAGTLSNLTVKTNSAQSVTGGLTFTVRKNGADTGLVVAIAASATAGVFSDNTHTVSLAQGDRVSLKGVNSATLISAQIGAVSMVLN